MGSRWSRRRRGGHSVRFRSSVARTVTRTAELDPANRIMNVQVLLAITDRLPTTRTALEHAPDSISEPETIGHLVQGQLFEFFPSSEAEFFIQLAP